MLLLFLYIVYSIRHNHYSRLVVVVAAAAVVIFMLGAAVVVVVVAPVVWFIPFTNSKRSTVRNHLAPVENISKGDKAEEGMREVRQKGEEAREEGEVRRAGEGNDGEQTQQRSCCGENNKENLIHTVDNDHRVLISMKAASYPLLRRADKSWPVLQVSVLPSTYNVLYYRLYNKRMRQLMMRFLTRGFLVIYSTML